MRVLDIFEKQRKSRKETYRLHNYTTVFGNKVSYMSQPGLKFIQDCEKNKIPVFNGEPIPYRYKGTEKIYFPDFKIKVEVKNIS